MQTTTDRPTAPGTYWRHWESTGTWHTVEVFSFRGRLCCEYTCTPLSSPMYDGCLWAGPIGPPAEPKKTESSS